MLSSQHIEPFNIYLGVWNKNYDISLLRQSWRLRVKVKKDFVLSMVAPNASHFYVTPTQKMDLYTHHIWSLSALLPHGIFCGCLQWYGTKLQDAADVCWLQLSPWSFIFIFNNNNNDFRVQLNAATHISADTMFTLVLKTTCCCCSISTSSVFIQGIETPNQIRPRLEVEKGKRTLWMRIYIR